MLTNPCFYVFGDAFRVLHFYCKVLASSNSEFHLKIKESLLISRDQPVLNKNEASLPLHLFD